MEHRVLYFLSNTIIFLWQVSPHGDLVHDFQVVLLVGEKNLNPEMFQGFMWWE